MPKLKILDDLLYRWGIVHELRKQLSNVSVNGYSPMATLCKKKKVRYDAYFYNDIHPYQCATCNAEYEEERDLNAHVSNVHDGKNPLKCDLCSSTFARINEQNRHRNFVHENAATHRCESCNEDFFENMG
jgi:uncharacterized C2H2 Zn-finger protein